MVVIPGLSGFGVSYDNGNSYNFSGEHSLPLEHNRITTGTWQRSTQQKLKLLNEFHSLILWRNKAWENCQYPALNHNCNSCLLTASWEFIDHISHHPFLLVRQKTTWHSHSVCTLYICPVSCYAFLLSVL